MNEIAKKIFETGKVVDDNGAVYEFHSSTSLEQCQFLQEIISENEATKCLEVGLAYGMSSMFICEAIQNKEGSILYSIDPQQGWWKNIGLKNIRDSGYSGLVEFHRDYSHTILPKLAAEGVQLDFSYVDTTKVFDVVMVDIYYLTQMLKIGGIVVVDDCDFPGINKIVRYIAKMPHYEVYRLHDEYPERKTLQLLSFLLKKIPFHKKIFSDKILNTDQFLGVNAHCVAFKKISNDTRNWDWYTSF